MHLFSLDSVYISLEKTGSTADTYKTSRTNDWLTLRRSNANIFNHGLCLILHLGVNLFGMDCTTARAFLCEDVVAFTPDIQTW
jgi:hypothetical protein